MMRYAVVVALLLIVGSLASALVFVIRDQSGSKRTLHALAIRVGLSIALFLFLIVGHYFGLIPGRLT